MGYEYTRVKTSDIVIPQEHQRAVDRDHVDDLFYSIGEHSLLQPIVVRRETGELVFGLHRLEAWKRHEAADPTGEYTAGIPARFVEDLNDTEILVLRLTENVRRKNLTWQEEAEAYLHLSEKMREEDPDWSDSSTAHLLKSNVKHVNRAIQVAKALRAGRQDIKGCDSLRSAYTLITKTIRRGVSSELLTFEKADLDPSPTRVPNPDEIETLDVSADELPDEVNSLVRDADQDVLLQNFADFAESYTGKQFDFLHCDFPYGIAFDKSAQAKTKLKETAYDDAESRFWDCMEILANYQDQILHPVSHIMFWFPMRNYDAVVRFLTRSLGWRVQPYPLVWHKTDDRGIVPDATREGRRVYETALMASRGDARIIEPVANAYGHPTAKDHASAKPAAMLQHFFRMFIRTSTWMLDPTCGSGSALVAATALGAAHVVGLDTSQDSVDVARDNLTSARLHKLEENNNGE